MSAESDGSFENSDISSSEDTAEGDDSSSEGLGEYSSMYMQYEDEPLAIVGESEDYEEVEGDTNGLTAETLQARFEQAVPVASSYILCTAFVFKHLYRVNLNVRIQFVIYK